MQGGNDRDRVEQTAGYAVSSDTLADTIRALAPGSTVLDVGCAGWSVARLAADLGRADLEHIGADLYGEPPGRPAEARFIPIVADGDPFASGIADLVISSHCLEHSRVPIEQFRSLVRAAKAGGLIYVETPSELSAAKMSADDPRDQSFGSFWDDPTHVRPYTPGALYRLGISFHAPALRCGRLERGGISCSAALFQRTAGDDFRYVSLRDVPPGTDAALAAIWPEAR